MEAGTSAGLRERAQRSSEHEAADRLKLAYDSLASHERMQSEAAMRKLDSQEAAMELRKQQMEGLQDYRNRRAGQYDTEEARRQGASESLNDYRNQRLDQFSTDEERKQAALEARIAQGEAVNKRVNDHLDLLRERQDSLQTQRDKEKKAVYTLKTGDGSTVRGTADDPVIAEELAKRKAANDLASAPPPPKGPGLLSRIGSFLTGGDEDSALPPVQPGAVPQSAANDLAPQAVPDAAPKRVKVVGPGGKTGTVPEGTDLPEGWKLAE